MPAQKISVKYCGGCNPRFDRPALVAKLRHEFPQLDFASAGNDAPWLSLTVNGCERKCAGGNLQSINGKIAVSAMKDFQAAKEKILRLFAEENH